MRFVTVAATVLLSLFSFATVSVGAQQPLRTVIVQESVTSAEALCAASEASSNLQMDPSLENTYKLIFHAPKSAVVPDFVEAHWSVIPLAGANPQDSATVSYNVRVAGTGVLSQSPDSTIVQEGVVIPAAHSIQFYHTYGINDIQCETQIKKYTADKKDDFSIQQYSYIPGLGPVSNPWNLGNFPRYIPGIPGIDRAAEIIAPGHRVIPTPTGSIVETDPTNPYPSVGQPIYDYSRGVILDGVTRRVIGRIPPRRS